MLLLVGLVLERSPVAERSPAPTAEDVRGARELYGRVRASQTTPGPDVIRVGWPQLAAAAALAGRAGGVERVAVQRVGDSAQLRASLPLPLGFWLNGHLVVRADESRELRLSARLGDLPVPAFMVHTGIVVARGVLRLLGARIPPLHTMVREVLTDSEGVVAVIELPSSTGVVSSITGLVASDIDAQRVAAHYCRLVATHRELPSDQFTEHVHRAFAAGDGTPGDNRALFVALSLLVAQFDGKTIPDERALFDRCGVAAGEIRLQGRADLAKHWAVSAALAAAYGTDASLSVGTWKEISDSGVGGSGFSLVDLAADRSGVFSARRGGDSGSAAGLRDWLRQATEADLLPVSALALAEGMTEAEFRARFADTDSAQFAATVQRIDAQLAVLQR